MSYRYLKTWCMKTLVLLTSSYVYVWCVHNDKVLLIYDQASVLFIIFLKVNISKH